MKLINELKRLFLVVSASSLINWIIFFVGIIGMILGFSGGFYKIMFLFTSLEVLFLNANYFYFYHRPVILEQRLKEKQEEATTTVVQEEKGERTNE